MLQCIMPFQLTSFSIGMLVRRYYYGFNHNEYLLESSRDDGAGLDAGGARALALVHGHALLARAQQHRVRIVLV